MSTFSELLEQEANKSSATESPQTVTTSAFGDAFKDAFGEDGEEGRYVEGQPTVDPQLPSFSDEQAAQFEQMYANRQMTQGEFDESYDGRTGVRFVRFLKEGGHRAARNAKLMLRAGQQTQINNFTKQLAALEAKGEDMTERDVTSAEYLQQNIDGLRAAANKVSASVEISQNAINLIGENPTSPASQKFHSPEATGEDILSAVGDDGFGIMGDFLASNAPMFLASAVGGFASRRGGWQTRAAVQGGIEGAITGVDEFAEKLLEAHPDVELTQDVVNKIMENYEELSEAYNVGLKAGGVGAVTGAFSTLLAVKGIIPMDALVKSPVKGTVGEFAAQTVAQGALGAGSEAAIAAAAGRDISAGEMIAGGVMGVASGAIDTAFNDRNMEITKRRVDLSAKNREMEIRDAERAVRERDGVPTDPEGLDSPPPATPVDPTEQTSMDFGDESQQMSMDFDESLTQPATEIETRNVERRDAPTEQTDFDFDQSFQGEMDLPQARAAEDSPAGKSPTEQIEMELGDEGTQVDMDFGSEAVSQATVDTMHANLDEIYGKSDVDLDQSVDASSKLVDDAAAEYNAVKKTGTAEEIAAARVKAIAAVKDHGVTKTRTAARNAEPSTRDTIEAEADRMADDDPSLMAYRTEVEKPKSKFDVPETDERYQAAQDYLSETDVVRKDAALDRFENPEKYDESRRSNEVQQGEPEVSGFKETNDSGIPSSSRFGRQRSDPEGQVAKEGSRLRDVTSDADKDTVPPADAVRGFTAFRDTIRKSESDAEGTTADGDTAPGEGVSGSVADRTALQDEAVNLAARSKGTVVLLDNWKHKDLPKHIRDQLEATGEGKAYNTRGLYDTETKKSYIFMDRNDSMDSVREVLMHEASHAVRNGTIPEFDARPELNNIYELLGESEGVIKYAKTKGIDLEHYAEAYKGSPEKKAYLITDELLAQIHGREIGALQQLSRRVLSKLENVMKMWGHDKKWFDKNGKVDGAIQRELARSERLMRDNNMLGKSKVGVMVPIANASYSNLVIDKFNLSPEAAKVAAAIEMKLNTLVPPVAKASKYAGKKWSMYMAANRGITDKGYAARVDQLAAHSKTSAEVSGIMEDYDRTLKGMSRADRKKFNVEANKYLSNDPKADTSKMSKDTIEVLNMMRYKIDTGSNGIVGVLAEQIAVKVARDLGRRKGYVSNGFEEALVSDLVRKVKEGGDDFDAFDSSFDLDIPDELKAQVNLISTMIGNMGDHLNTSYAAFDKGGSYYKKVKADTAKYDQFTGWIQEMAAEEGRKISKEERLVKKKGRKATVKEIEAAEKGRKKSQEEAKKAGKGRSISKEEARAELSALLKKAGENDQQQYITSGGSVMGISKTSYKKKHLNDKRMKAILGEHTDVLTNFERTVTAQQGIIANHTMQKNLHDLFLKSGMLSETKFESPDSYLELNEEIMSNDKMSVLDGYYTTPVVKEALKTFQDQTIHNFVVTHMNHITSKINFGKTVLSPSTQIMNPLNNYFIRAASGHAFYRAMSKAEGNPVDIPGPIEIKKMMDSYRKGDPKARREVHDLIATGIAGESIVMREYGDLVHSQNEHVKNAWNEHIMESESDSKVIEGAQKATRTVKRFNDAAKNFYSDGDDIFKIESYYIEKHKAKTYLFPEKDFDMSDSAEVKRRDELIREHAITTTRRQHLMYSETNRLVGMIREFPVIGQFVSFPAALTRAAKEQLKLASSDMVNEKLPKSLRFARIGGMLTLAAIVKGVPEMTSMLMGMDEDEERSIRQTLPEWARLNDIIWLGRYANGDPRYYNLSRMNPYDYLTKGVKQLTKKNEEGFFGLGGNALNMVEELGSPFFMPGIAAVAATTLATGFRPGTGSKITNEALSENEQAGDRLTQFFLDISPGGLTQGINIFKAANNDAKWYGGEKGVLEAISSITGAAKINRLDMDLALQFKTKDYKRMRGNARQILGREMNSLENVPDYDDVKSKLYNRYEAETRNAEDMARMIEVSQEQGVSNNKIRKTLISMRMSKKDIAVFLAGDLPRLGLTGNEADAGLRSALGQADTPQEEAQAREDHRQRELMLRRAHKEWLRERGEKN